MVQEQHAPAESDHLRSNGAGSVASAVSRPLFNRSNSVWQHENLVERTVIALEMALRAVRLLVNGGRAEPGDGDSILSAKIVSETAMLLLCVAPIAHLDERLFALSKRIASLLVPHARSPITLASICMEPGLARDHAVAHVLLSRLGYPDPGVDRLLGQALSLGNDFGPERLVHRRLENQWLQRVWPIGAVRSAAGGEPGSRLLSESMLGRPLDVLAASRLDCYAFTHAVLYASDLGTRRVRLPRPGSEIAGDALGALAFSLDSEDFDLSAEVLATWPMLRLPWSPSASFAFRVLAEAQDELGFLPGLAFERSRYQRLHGRERIRYALTTSYHTIYTMGFLTSSTLVPGRAPPASVHSARKWPGIATALLGLLDQDARPRRWRRCFDELTARQQDAIGPLLAAIILRRAAGRGNLAIVREVLAVSFRHGLIEGSAIRQAAALLRRSQVLTELASRWTG